LWQREVQKVLKINTPTVESQWNLYSKVSKYGNDKRDYLRGFVIKVVPQEVCGIKKLLN
jgi:hypothetical protein